MTSSVAAVLRQNNSPAAAFLAKPVPLPLWVVLLVTFNQFVWLFDLIFG